MKLLRRENLRSLLSPVSRSIELAAPSEVLVRSRLAHQRLQAAYPDDVVNFGILANPLDPSSHDWRRLSNAFPVNETDSFPPTVGQPFTVWSVGRGYQSARLLREEQEPCRPDCDHPPCVHRTFILAVRQSVLLDKPSTDGLISYLMGPVTPVAQPA